MARIDALSNRHPPRVRTRRRAALALLLLSSACGRVFEYPVVSSENNAEACVDGIDNDLDGLADCYDSQCAAFCRENTARACADGIDNDVDGKLDCKDDDCAKFCQENTVEACADGVDNDGDRKLDCKDEDCAAFCQETGAAACSNHQDDDHDGLVDCADTDCDGFCPEESAADCADRRDNDGDGLTDAADPRCWLLTPPTVQRCASPDIDFRERFEEAYVYPAGTPQSQLTWGVFDSRWDASGTAATYGGRSVTGVVKHEENHIDPYRTAGRADQALAFVLTGNDGPGRLVSHQVFSGSWQDVELSFSARVDDDSVLKVQLVPQDPQGAEGGPLLLGLFLDRTGNPPLFVLRTGASKLSGTLPVAPFQACGSYPCDNAWVQVRASFVDGGMRATVSGATESVTLSSPPFDVLDLPPSRLMLQGRSGSGDRLGVIDDVRLRIAPRALCGFKSPQVPQASCGYSRSFPQMGRTLALARDDAGLYCALVEGTHPDGSSALTTWTSRDGGNWTPAVPYAAGAELSVPSQAALGGVGLAYDGRGFVAAAVLRDKRRTQLALGHGASCAKLSQLSPGPALPDDAEGPSYLVNGGRHEVYFTRPPTSESRRSLWRLSGPDQAHLELEPKPLAELPGEAPVSPPVTITRAGSQDLLMVYPTRAGSGALGLALLVGSADAHVWTPLTPQPLLATLAPTFDGDGPTVGALSFDGNQGLFVYGGSWQGKVTTGVARLFAAGTEPSAAEPVASGDDACSDDASCLSCPLHCESSSRVLSDGDLASADPPWHGTSLGGGRTFYFDQSTESLILKDGDGWAETPLDKAISGDFELELDLTVPSEASENHDPTGVDSLYIGLGEPPAGTMSTPHGVFARITIIPASAAVGACFADNSGFALSTFVGGDTWSQSTLQWQARECNDSRLWLPFDVMRHVQLVRRGGTLTVTALDENGCPASVSMPIAQTLPRLSSLVVGIFNTWTITMPGGNAEISHLRLRALDDANVCPAGTSACAEKGEEPACIDLTSSPEHCGACDAACKPGAACSNGVCSCPPELTDCPDECADLKSSVNNCGSCGNQCNAYCLAGECDAGETCDTAKRLPTGDGSYALDLSKARADDYWCGSLGFLTDGDLFFAWTANRTGKATFSLEGATVYLANLLAVTPDPSCQSYDLSWCTATYEGEPLTRSSLTLDVEQGTTYYITAATPIKLIAGPGLLTVEER